MGNKTLLLRVALLVLGVAPLSAAELQGIVRSGALAIPGATVTARQGEQRVATATDESGRYRFAELADGEWSLEVEMFGFAPLSQQIQLAAGSATQDLPLTLAARPPAATPGGLAERRRALSLRTSQPDQFDQALRSLEQTSTAAPSADLYRSSTESFLVNGSVSRGLDAPRIGFGAAGLRTMTTGADGPAGNPFGESPGTVTELAANAPQGARPGAGRGGARGGGRRDGGGGGGGPGARGGRGGPLANMSPEQRRAWMEQRGALAFGNRINAGRRAMRGALNFSLGNSALDARPYSLTGAQADKASYAQSNFGASIGGQLRIPKIIQDEETFFFLNYRGTRSRNPFDSVATVPTVQERGGDFSQSLARGPVSIFDPTTGLPFTNQLIPQSQLDPAALGLALYLAEPNQTGSVQNYRFLTSVPRNSDNFSIRVNRSVSPKDRLSVAYNLQMNNAESAQLQGFRDQSDGRGQSANVGWTRNISGTTVNNVRATFSRNRSSRIPFFAYGENVASDLGINGSSQDPINYGPPNLSFTNFGSLTDGSPSRSTNQTFGINEDLTLIRGKHNWKLGFGYRRLQLNQLTEENARGSFSFSGFATSAVDAQGFSLANTGFDYADFLLGLPQSSSIRFGNPDYYLRGRAYDLYIQDDWRVSGNLSFNLGMRYEFQTPFREVRDRLVNLDLAPGFEDVAPVLPGAVGPFTGEFRRALIDPDRNNIAPRIGIAWKPWGSRSSVVRAGYGIYFNGSVYNQAGTRLAQQPPFSTSGSLTSGVDGLLTIQDGLAVAPSTSVANTFAIARDYRVGYAQTWNLSIQNNLSQSVVLEVGYLGTKGTRLDVQRSPNRAGADSEDGDRPIANATGFIVDTSEGNSIYHAAQVRLSKRFSSGFAGNLDYTWAKSIDNVSTFGGGQAVVALYDADLSAERGLSSFDQRHVLNLNFTVNSPIGRRSAGAPPKGLTERLLRDWTLSTALRAADGTPLTAAVLGNQANAGGTGIVGSGRAQATGESILLDGAFFNPNAFTTPLPGELGNAGRNTIPGPRQLSLDLSFGRNFRLSDRARMLEFRIEANNLTNTVSFVRLGTTVNSSNYGLAAAAAPMRTLTASARLRF